MVVLPAWLDEEPDIDFGPERDLLTDLETWAEAEGWHVTDGASLPPQQRRRTDVLLEKPGTEDRVRVAVLRRTRGGMGIVRFDASTLRTIELVRQRRKPRCRLEISGVPVEGDVRDRGWRRVFELLFKP